jgi:hypothetical protein
VDGEIALCNALFGVSWSGAKASNSETVLSGTANGITITYSIGSSANMYCNDSQIRMYGGNELKIESGSEEMARLEFVTIDSTKKLLLIEGGGSVDGYTWTGKSNSVTFGSEANHIKMSAVRVTLVEREATAIASMHNSQCLMLNEVYDMQGRRVGNTLHSSLKKGVYIQNGRKVILR